MRETGPRCRRTGPTTWQGSTRASKACASPTARRLAMSMSIPRLPRPSTEAVTAAAALGAEVERADPGFADPGPCFRTYGGRVPVRCSAICRRRSLRCLIPTCAMWWSNRASITLDDYLAATSVSVACLVRTMRQFMEGYDLLVTPTLPIPAFEAGRLSPGRWCNRQMGELDAVFLPFQPDAAACCKRAVWLYCGRVCPSACILVGRMFDDKTVLRAAHAYEKATDLAPIIIPSLRLDLPF